MTQPESETHWIVYEPSGGRALFHDMSQTVVADWVLVQPFDPNVDRHGGYRYKTKALLPGEEPPLITKQQARRKQVDLDKILKPKEEHEDRL